MTDDHHKMTDKHRKMTDKHWKMTNEHQEMTHKHQEMTHDHQKIANEHLIPDHWTPITPDPQLLNSSTPQLLKLRLMAHGLYLHLPLFWLRARPPKF